MYCSALELCDPQKSCAEGTELALAFPDLWLPCPQGGSPCAVGGGVIVLFAKYVSNSAFELCDPQKSCAEGTELALAFPDLWLPCPQGGSPCAVGGGVIVLFAKYVLLK